MQTSLAKLADSGPTMQSAVAVMVIGASTLLGAWYFQYVVGLVPCPLCLEQRVAYYFAIPLSVMVMLGAQYGANRKVLQLAMLAIALGMLWNAGLGVYHSGIEWKWWPGPSECSGVPNFRTADDVLKGGTTIVRCDQAAWRFLGLSLAGYNALISLALAAVALRGATSRTAYGSSSESQ